MRSWLMRWMMPDGRMTALAVREPDAGYSPEGDEAVRAFDGQGSLDDPEADHDLDVDRLPSTH